MFRTVVGWLLGRYRFLQWRGRLTIGCSGRLILPDVFIARTPRRAIISGIAGSHHSVQQDRLELAHAELEERIYPGTFANVLMGSGSV